MYKCLYFGHSGITQVNIRHEIVSYLVQRPTWVIGRHILYRRICSFFYIFIFATFIVLLNVVFQELWRSSKTMDNLRKILPSNQKFIIYNSIIQFHIKHGILPRCLKRSKLKQYTIKLSVLEVIVIIMRMWVHFLKI